MAGGSWRGARRRGGRGADHLAPALPLEFALVAAVPSLLSPGSGVAGRRRGKSPRCALSAFSPPPGLQPPGRAERQPASLGLVLWGPLLALERQLVAGVWVGVGREEVRAAFGDIAGFASSRLQIFKQERAEKVPRPPHPLLRHSGGSRQQSLRPERALGARAWEVQGSAKLRQARSG